jgi:YD repeat-containing protein
VTAVTLQNSETLELSNVSYAYDPIGNRTGATNGAAAFSYSANALNQYSNLQSTAYSLQPSYDPDGNMLTNGPWAYTWDAENRLVSATDGERTVYYAYDHRSRLTYRCALTPQGMAESAFTYDGWNPLDEFHYENSGPGE